MNQAIERFGQLVGNQAAAHPARAAAMLGTAYRLVGAQAAHFPSKKRTSSREYLQGYTANLMADMLQDPSHSAVVNIFMPAEIFHAMGIPIMAPEALATYVACTAAEQSFLQCAEDAGAPETLCSYHRCLLGMAQSGVMKKPLLVANTTLACDANQLTFRELAGQWQVPHVVIDVPYEVNEEAVAYVAQQLRDMTRLIEQLTGRRLDPARLSHTVSKSQRTMENYRAYLKLRPTVHFPEALTPELELDICNHLFLGTDAAVTFTQKLLNDVRMAPPLSTQKKILWMHVLPNWQDTMCHIFQGMDNGKVEVIGSDLAYSAMEFDGAADSLSTLEPDEAANSLSENSGASTDKKAPSLRRMDPMDPDHPYESMARRLVYDSYNGPGTRRIRQTLRLARAMKADGILIFCQWGCKQTQGISMAAKRTFEAAGFPTLILDGDACDRVNGGSEQIVTRANAFVEQLHAGIRSCLPS